MPTQLTRHWTKATLAILAILAAAAMVAVFALNGEAGASEPQPQETIPAQSPQPAPSPQPGWNLHLVGQNGIHVTGRGTASGPPDYAVLRLTVSTEAETAAVARQTNGRITRRVAEALRIAGVEDQDLSTTNFSLYPTYRSFEEYVCEDGRRLEFPTGPSCRRTLTKELTGYVVNNSITASTSRVETVTRMVDRASSAGGNEVTLNSVNLTIKDNTNLRNEAMNAALLDMREKARLMAQGSNVTLGTLTNVTEGQGSFSPYRRIGETEGDIILAGIYEESSHDYTEILSGDLQVSVHVNGTYSIVSR